MRHSATLVGYIHYLVDFIHLAGFCGTYPPGMICVLVDKCLLCYVLCYIVMTSKRFTSL